MAVILSYGNKPPSRSDVQLGRQVKTSTLAEITALQHELWATSGELCFELIYDGTSTWKTDLTTYVQQGIGSGSQYHLQRCSPLLDLRVANNTGGHLLTWRAFVRNLQIQVSILDTSHVLVAASNASATNNDPQWIGSALSISSVPVQRIVKIEARRLAFDTSGELAQIAGRIAPSGAAQIPGHL